MLTTVGAGYQPTRRLARLRERAPDLADLVDEGRMRLTEAQSAWQTREEDARRAR